MRTINEIADKLNELSERPQTPKVRVMIETIEDDLSDDEIESKFHDENDPWIEQDAMRARQWMDGEDVEL